MISAVDFEDIFGWGPARARTGLPTQPSQPSAVSSLLDEPAVFEVPAPTYALHELRPPMRPARRDLRNREYAAVTA